MDFFFVLLGLLGVALSLKVWAQIGNSTTKTTKVIVTLATCVLFYGGLAILLGASI